MSKGIQIQESLQAIRAALSEADRAFFFSDIPSNEGEHYYLELTKCYIEEAFIQLFVLLDALNLSRIHEQVSKIFQQAESEGFNKSAMGIEDPYLVWSVVISNYADAIGKSYGYHRDLRVSRDLICILRDTAYTITDRSLFGAPPKNELELHKRIEGVLRCVFPDLKHKPQLSKPIKNFEPDTGLPSIRTLIEYKFIETHGNAKSVADEILADTRGYLSKEWDTFLFVIYEMYRIKRESEWQQLLYECGVGENTQIIVISGEPTHINTSTTKVLRTRPYLGQAKPSRNKKHNKDLKLRSAGKKYNKT